MIRDLIKWVVPGLATVLGGTTLCLAMTSTAIVDDLAARSTAAMAAGGYDWAELSLDARDLTLSGTTTDQALLDAAVARLSGLDGIRSVIADVTLAPMARPYRLEASIDHDAVTLSGGVPNETMRQRLLALAGSGQGTLELRSGVPDRRAWAAGVDFAIDQLQYFDQGQASVSDLTVNLSGRAKSERAFRDLLIVLRAGAPAGLSLGEVTIIPALVSPYSWQASFDGKRIDVSGYVPDDATAERFRTADVSGVPVATGLTLGSGEPAGFVELSERLVEQLSRLEYGTASITDGQSTLSGAPATQEIAQAVVEALEPSGSIITLEPPRIEDYWMSASRQAGGVVVFDGYVPDEATREAFSQREGADTSYLKLGRGAPERFQSGADFGLEALDRMSEGRIALRGNVLTISGTARSGADYEALMRLLAEAPQGLELAQPEIVAPPADSYSWSATKHAAGAIVLAGLVPNTTDEAQILAAAGQSATETMTYASGQPDGFIASAETGLALLGWLREGSVAFDGLGWTVTGTANSAIDRAALEADFVTRRLAAAGWSMAIAEPPPVLPQVSPYTWSATRSADGVSLMGHVPNQGLKNYLAVLAGDSVVDSTALGLGAPENFAAAARGGLDAVLALEEGEISFDGAAWSLSGRAASEAQRDSVLAALATATDQTGWTVDIAAPAPEPDVTTPYVWSATKTADGAVTLNGLVPVETLRRVAAVRAGDNVTDQTTIDPTAPEGFAEDLLAALDALAALSEGSARFDGLVWSVRGTLRDTAASAQFDTALDAAATPATNWVLAVTAPPATTVASAPETVEPAPEPAPEPVIAPEPPAPPPEPEPVAPPQTAAARPVDITACAAPVAEFSARNSILFQSGAALIAAESDAALDELALDLAACPDAVVHIEGHTDADGDEGQNLALSVARAEAVVNALVTRGVTPARLYAVGYGEAAPIADNETAAGKRLNRRIVVTVQPQHF